MDGWIIALVSTIAGTIVGWILPFIKRRRLIFSEIKIEPANLNRHRRCTAYFNINLHNLSDNTRAIRNPKIRCYSNKKIILEEGVQESELSETPAQKEEFEKFSKYISMLEVQPRGNIAQYCRIEFGELDENVTKAYLIYKNEKFREKKKKIFWKND